MRFADLISADPTARLVHDTARDVTDVVFDSRDVRPGAVFVARRGLRDDGHEYVNVAVRSGAAAVVAERSVETPNGIGFAVVANGRRALAALARKFWGDPDRELGMVGVTGTDGKTTTCRLIAWMLRAYAIETGEMTTVSMRIGDEERSKGTRLTTPEAPAVARAVREMADARCGWAVIEVASHALELARVESFGFDRAVITNVTHEHLDVHGSIEGYRRAKRHLLDLLGTNPDSVHGKAAILNAADPVVAEFASGLPHPVVTFAVDAPADVSATWSTLDTGHITVRGSSPWGGWDAPTHLLGGVNAWNVAAAIACVGSITGDPGPGAAFLAQMPPVPGRMQVIDRGQPFRLIVDFAHTPHSLEGRLRELRDVTSGRLIVVFGSAGEQDVAKRPMLGAVAARTADLSIVADEDPRGELPMDIAQAIVRGGQEAEGGGEFEIILDRRAAIRRVIEIARPGDTVLLTGKGHEPNILYDGYALPWDEAGIAREELEAAGYAT